MRLSDLLATLPEMEIVQSFPQDLSISNIAHDSRAVKPGTLFVAIAGQISDGHQYIEQAVKNGAVAIVGQKLPDTAPEVPFIITPESRTALADLAAAFYDFPARKLRMIGVTGTDGKTTTVELIRAILVTAGFKAGMITTLGATISESRSSTGVHVTTPDALEMQHYLSEMVANGAQFGVIETTSHGLVQQRVRQCGIDVAVITNVTHEHLDYHQTYQEYLEAKSLLFQALHDTTLHKPGIPKISILNKDDSSYEHLLQIPAEVKLTYGLKQPADFTATELQYRTQGMRFTASTPQGAYVFELALIGEHNVYNALAAIAVAYSQGVDMSAIQKGIASVRRITGRMEQMDLGQDFDVFMDYAHTPNALEQVLEVSRKLAKERVIVVCGLSGGLRDRSKRENMGRIAGELADKIVITSMDWYDEDVSEIMGQIAAGCDKAGRQEGLDYWCVRDRKEGIARGLDLAETGDFVLVCGKAHENSISYGSTEFLWNEYEVVKENLDIKLKS